MASGWNIVTANTPEYNRYDGLNTEWYVDSYDAINDNLYLRSPSIGNYTNTNVKWADDYNGATSCKFTLGQSVLGVAGDIIGPYVFDPTQQFVISGTTLTTTQQINQGTSYSTISVVSGAFSIEPGWLVFNYGNNNQEGPVHCFGSTDDITLEIDAGYKFKNDLPVGSIINVLFQRAAYNLPSPLGAFWLTASNAGRTAAINFLQQISAAGIELDIITRYPGDRALGNEGFPVSSNYKLSDIVECFGSDNVDQELADARSS